MEPLYIQLAKECEIINRNFANVGEDINAIAKALAKQRRFNTKTTILLVVGGICIYGIAEQCKELTKKVNDLEQEVYKLKYPDVFKED